MPDNYFLIESIFVITHYRMRTLLLFVGIFLVACTSKAPVDETTLKSEIAAVMNNYHRGLLNKDAALMLDGVSEDGLLLGTDPKEFFSKSQLEEYLKASFEDTTLYEPYSVERDIRIGPEGKSAIVIEQYLFKVISPVIPIRGIAHVRKDGNDWVIDFYSLSLIPTNEDLEKINSLLPSSSPQ